MPENYSFINSYLMKTKFANSIFCKIHRHDKPSPVIKRRFKDKPISFDLGFYFAAMCQSTLPTIA